MSVAQALITVEEYSEMPDDGRRTELVRGRIIELPPPKSRHGRICYRVASILGGHVEAHDLGTVLINDAGIITRRDPDTVRGADVAFYSYARMPRGPVPDTYPDVAPELVFEVRSTSERWRDVQEKAAEYLGAGVLVVCVLDPETRSAHRFHHGQPTLILGPVDELTFPECLPDFLVVVQRFFD